MHPFIGLLMENIPTWKSIHFLCFLCSILAATAVRMWLLRLVVDIFPSFMRVWKWENCCSNEHKTVKDLDAISLAHLGSIFSLKWQQRNHWIESRSCWEQISGYKCNFHSTKETLLFQIQSPLTQLYLIWLKNFQYIFICLTRLMLGGGNIKEYFVYNVVSRFVFFSISPPSLGQASPASEY